MADEIIRYKEIYDSADSQAKIKYLMELEKQRSVLGGKAFDEKKAQTKAEVKLWDEIVTAQKRAAAGPSEWTLALRANTAAVTEARGSINKAREATGAFAAALSLLSPEAAAAAQGLQKAEGAAAGLAASGELAGVSAGALTTGLGVVAAAAIPAYLAFRQSAADLEEMDRWVNITAEDLKNLKAGTDTIVEAQFELDRRAQKLRGEMTEQEAATYAAAEAQKVYKGTSDALSESLDNQTKRLEEMRRRLSDKTMLETLGDWFNPFSENSSVRLAAIKQQAAEVERLKGKVGELDEAEGEYAGRLKGIIVDEERRTSGVKKEKEEIEGLSELLKQIAADEAAAEKAQASRQRSAEKHFREREAQAKKEADDAKKAQEQALADLLERREEERKLAEQAAAEQRDLYAASLYGAATLSDSLASLTAEKQAQAEERVSDLQDAIDAAEEKGQTAKAARLKKRQAEEKKAVLATFETGQDLAKAGVIMDTAKAIMAAWAIGPIAGPIAAAAATAAGAVELAVVSKQEPPQFDDTPGVMEGTGAGSQRQIVSLDPRDKWLAARDMDGLMRQFIGAIGSRRSSGGMARTPRNEAMLAYNAVGAYGQDIARITRPGGF